MASYRTSAAPMPIRIVMQDPGSRQTRRERHQEIAQARSHSARFIGRKVRWDRAASWRRQLDSELSDHSTPSGKGSEDGEDQEAPRTAVQDSLTQNKRDPFSPYSSPRGPTIFQELVEFAYDTLWPDIIEVSGNPAIHPGRREWRLAALENPAVYHVHRASVADFGKAIYHSDGLCDDFDKLRLFHHTEALRLVRNMIQATNQDSIPSDALIMAVYNLSYQGTGWDYRTVPESHPPSPLFQARLMGRFGRKTAHYDHVRALNALIKAKGGLEEIKLAGIAEMIWLWSLDYRSALTSTPVFPLLLMHETLLEAYDKRIKTLIREDDFQGMGSGFLVLPNSGIFGKLRDCLLCTAAITVDLEQMRPYRLNCPNFRQLLRAARGCHHQLLSLPPDIEDSETDDTRGDRLLYQISRLAGLLYHDIVIFPHVDTSGIKPLLARRLHDILVTRPPSLAAGASSGRYDDLVLWALLLGSIGSTWTKHRSWFVEQLHERSQQLGVDTFEQFKPVTSKYLWFENMDEPALKTWMGRNKSTDSSSNNG
ncbi:hypothetical protein H2200_011242 [Cladophialophora chaetospira]|uniref:Uncharacterized protein n=1 Tax=Cladophialophora chaetospira TaxID=386627 RepID=A0AA38X0B5_9EURO|nr:hypothetical protein H2200_011242 [Cladophialophora chaetospira]